MVCACVCARACVCVYCIAVYSLCPETVTSLGSEKTPLCAEICKQHSRTHNIMSVVGYWHC